MTLDFLKCYIGNIEVIFVSMEWPHFICGHKEKIFMGEVFVFQRQRVEVIYFICATFRLQLLSGINALEKNLCSKKTIRLNCLSLIFLHSHYLYLCNFFLCFRVELGHQLLSMCVVFMLATKLGLFSLYFGFKSEVISLFQVFFCLLYVFCAIFFGQKMVFCWRLFFKVVFQGFISCANY